MFNIGIAELILIFVVALIVIGPKQLPGIARSLGRLAGELKRSLGDLNTELKNSSDVIHKPLAKEKKSDEPEA